MFKNERLVAKDKIATLEISKEYLHIFNFYILIFQYLVVLKCH